MNPRPALLHRSRTALLVLVLVLYLFSHPGRMMAQQTGSALKASASGILDNALFITDYNPNGGGSSPCLGPGRLFRIPRMSGWEAGPTVSGLTFDLPTHFSFDSSGRIYVADRENRRVVRMDNVTGSGWKAFSGVGSNLLSMPGARSSCVESLDGVYATAIDSSGRIYISTANPSRIVRIDDMDGAGWTSLNSLSGGTLYLTRSIALDAQGRL